MFDSECDLTAMSELRIVTVYEKEAGPWVMTTTKCVSDSVQKHTITFTSGLYKLSVFHHLCCWY